MPKAAIFGTLAKVAIVAFVLLADPMAEPAAAQDRPDPAVEFAAGSLSFADDGVVNESMAGGGIRALVGDRVLVGLETRVGWELHLRLSGLVGLQLR